MIQFTHLNGVLTRLSEASLRVTDLAILRGYGVFDFFLFEEHQPLFLDDYLQRFIQSAKALNLHLAFDLPELSRQVYELIAANQLKDGAIRLVATGGYAPDGYTPDKANLIILQHPYPSYPESYFTAGVRLLPYAYQRELPRAKSINYLKGISVLPELKAANAIEALYHDGQYLRETVRANFFLVTPDNTLVTPQKHILLGITRKMVLRAAKSQFEVEEREVAVEEIKVAKEAFLTSSTRGVMPVVMVGEQKIGTGIPGPITLQLMKNFKQTKKDYVNSREQLTSRQS